PNGYEALQNAIASIAIVLCLSLGFLLTLGASTLLKWKDGLREIEKEPEFAYLKGKKMRPQTDIGDGITKWGKWRDWRQYYSLVFPILFIVIWTFCLAVVPN
ncbi:unnamed protein product, partial [marine sediment metagenome]